MISVSVDHVVVIDHRADHLLAAVTVVRVVGIEHSRRLQKRGYSRHMMINVNPIAKSVLSYTFW